MAKVKFEGKKLSASMARKVLRLKKAPNKVPYMGFTFDLIKARVPRLAWSIIKGIAEKYGLEHIQQSVYVIWASEKTEELANEILHACLNEISKLGWIEDGLKSMHCFHVGSIYDVIAAFKADADIEIEPVEMNGKIFKFRRAYAGGYEKMVQDAVEAGVIEPESIIHDNAPHFGVVFDIHAENHCALLKAVYGEGDYKNVWTKVRKVMESKGFERSHGSAYICSKEPAFTKKGAKLANSAITNLYWLDGFNEVIKDIKVVEFYRTFDITFLMKGRKMAAFKKAIKKALAAVA